MLCANTVAFFFSFIFFKKGCTFLLLFCFAIYHPVLFIKYCLLGSYSQRWYNYQHSQLIAKTFQQHSCRAVNHTSVEMPLDRLCEQKYLEILKFIIHL